MLRRCVRYQILLSWLEKPIVVNLVKLRLLLLCRLILVLETLNLLLFWRYVISFLCVALLFLTLRRILILCSSTRVQSVIVKANHLRRVVTILHVRTLTAELVTSKLLSLWIPEC